MSVSTIQKGSIYKNNLELECDTLDAQDLSCVNLSVTYVNGLPYNDPSAPQGSVIPAITLQSDLGAINKYWLNTYSANYYGQLQTQQTNLSAVAVTAQNLTGTLQTAAQPNITSLGNLTSTLNTNSIYPNIGDTYALGDPDHKYLNIYSNNLYGQLQTQQTNLSAVAVTAQNLTGTLQTAAQPNITILGNLTSTLNTQSVYPNINDTYALGTALLKYNSVFATNLTGTLQTAAQPNITSLGNLTGLTINGAINNLTWYGLPGVVKNSTYGVLSTGSIDNADISASAAIANSKLEGNPTSANLANRIVLRDSNFSFSAGSITVGSLSVGSVSNVLNTVSTDLIIQNLTTDASIITRLGSTGGNGSQFKVQDSASQNIMLIDDVGSMYVKDGIYPNTASQGYVGNPSQRFGNAYLVNADIQTNLVCSGLAGAAGIAHISSSGLFSNSQIVNADIASGASIADSKLAQITSTNKVADSSNASLAAATSVETANTLVKRDNDGAFNGVTINSTYRMNAVTSGALDPCIFATALNGSYVNSVLKLESVRSGTGSFNFWQCYSQGDSNVRSYMTGDGNLYLDGTVHSPADIAEYFESVTGESLAIGRTVVMQNGKVRYYNAQTDTLDQIIGVVRPKTSGNGVALTGNAAALFWWNRFLVDDYDAVILNSEGEWLKNPDWDPTVTYIPRQNRPEWNLIGLLGQIKISNGEPINPRWVLMSTGINTSKYLVR